MKTNQDKHFKNQEQSEYQFLLSAFEPVPSIIMFSCIEPATKSKIRPTLNPW